MLYLLPMNLTFNRHGGNNTKRRNERGKRKKKREDGGRRKKHVKGIGTLNYDSAYFNPLIDGIILL